MARVAHLRLIFVGKTKVRILMGGRGKSQYLAGESEEKCAAFTSDFWREDDDKQH